jgi:hypothetical protein
MEYLNFEVLFPLFYNDQTGKISLVIESPWEEDFEENVLLIGETIMLSQNYIRLNL